MFIGSRQKPSTLSLELSIDNVSIKQVSTTKSLEILIDDNMAWHNHIDKLSKNIASGIGAMHKAYEILCFPKIATLHLQCLDTTPFQLL